MADTGLLRVRWCMRALNVAMLSLAASGVLAQPAGPRASEARQVDGARPVRFEENRGQADRRVRYISRARDYTVALTADETLLLVRKPASTPGAPLQASDLALVRMRLLGASPTPQITAFDPVRDRNLFLADSREHTSLKPIESFARVRYSNVYPGVDVVYYGRDQQLEFDFVVSPFADPERIALSLDGVDGLTLTDTGDLSMRVGGAAVRLKTPVVYQERDGHRIEIPGAYVLPADSSNTVRFRLGVYDRSLPLVIDPTWLTVFGSTSEDTLSGMVVDSLGHTRVLGTTFDPATFPFTQLETGSLPPPNCFLTKSDYATGLPLYTILFANTASCKTLALSPNNVAYFTGFVYPNAFQNNQGTTVTMVDDSTGVPVISRFGVLNYDSSPVGDGVDALAVNSLGHVFLLGPCRLVAPGDPALQLGGFNETPDPPDGAMGEGCAPGLGLPDRLQPILTVVDSTGDFLYGSFLSPGELAGEYGLAADAAGRAYIVGAFSAAVSPTPDAYLSACPPVSRSAPLCGYLMVLDTTVTGPASLTYASYLWNTENAATVAVRLGPTGEVFVASEGRIFEDFPSNRPTNTAAWPYTLFPSLMEGIQLARFNINASGAPNLLEFATVFDPSRAVAALAGLTAREQLADLRLFPSGAPAIGTIAHTESLPPMGIVTTFERSGDRVGEVWTHSLGSRGPAPFAVAAGPGGSLFLAGQIDRAGAQDSDIFVEQIEAEDPDANAPPTVRILESLSTNGGPLTIFADAPNAGALLQLNALTDDPDGDALTYSWSGPFIDNPITTNNFISGRLALGPGQIVTLTVDDGHGNVVSIDQVIDVVGTPFVGTTATPIDSTLNGMMFSYAPLTITATAIGAAGGNAFLRTRLDQIPAVPANLQAGSPPIYFDVSADAILVAPFTVCINTQGMSLANAAGVRLYHYQQPGPFGSWVDITSPGSPQGQQVCGQSNALGTFALFYPQVASTALQTIGGTGVLVDSIDGPGGDASDDYRDGPAAATALSYLYGGAFDRARNHLIVSSGAYIMRLNLNDNTIARIAGNGVFGLGSVDGVGGDLRDDVVEGGDAFGTFVGDPAALALAPNGDVVFFDRSTCRIRRLDVAQGLIFSVAGNGTCGFSGDGANAALASLSSVWSMAFDAAGNLFISDGSVARIRRIDAITNVIDTVAGDGTFGIPANGSPRTTISLPTGIAFDAQGHLLIAGGMHLLRLSPGANAVVDGGADETMTVIGGCNTNCQVPFNGDGLAVSHPQVYLPGMSYITVAQDGSLLLSDAFRLRRIIPGADGIVTGAADEIISTIAGYYDESTLSQIPNFNGDTFSTQSLFSHSLFPFDDLQGRIIVVDSNNVRVRRFGLPGPVVDPNSADLAIAVVASPDPVDANAGLRYDLSITNNGPATATGVTMTYVIPAGAVFVSATGAGVCTTPAVGSGGTVVCDMGAMASGATQAMAIVISPQTAGTLASTFSVASIALDPVAGNNSSTVSTVVSVGPVVIDVHETVVVADAAMPLPSAMIGIVEQVTVSDAPVPLPSIVIGVVEAIVVSDAPDVIVDNTPPVITVPGAVVSEAETPSGAVVTFTANATDNAPGVVNVVCSPQSGSLFPFNGSSPTTTAVTCTATDAAGNAATASFDVIVRDTTPPQVVTSPIAVAATEASGTRGNVPQAPHSAILQQLPLLASAVDAADPNPARISAQWVACGNPAQVLGVIADTSLYPVGPNCFSYVFSDASGNAGTGILSMTVSAPIGGHINAANVPVTATDLNNVSVPVTATFLALDQPGLLTAVPAQLTPPAPIGLAFDGAAFEIRSTALAPSAVVVCLQGTASIPASRLFLLEQAQWIDRTGASNPATGEVCSIAGPVGTFALARSPLSLTLTPQTATVDITLTHAVEARVVDQSDPDSRITFVAAVPLVIEFRDPLTANAPLSVTQQYDQAAALVRVTVSLATNSAGQLTRTASQVAAAINASPGVSLQAATWPGATGGGIVPPSPPRQLSRLAIDHPSLSGNPPIYISAPGRAVVSVSGGALQTDSITAHLDLDNDGVVETGEPTAAAEVTWVDLTPPVLTLPTGGITVTATSLSGAQVQFIATAVDAVSGPVSPVCTPASGALFAVGSTTVNCTAADPSGNIASGSFGVTVLPFVSVPPMITSVSPPMVLAGSAGATITIIGSGFAGNATALWNGSPRPTVVNSATQLSVSIPAADLASPAYLSTTLIAVRNPGPAVSNSLPFLIVSSSVISASAGIALPGQSVTASNVPNQAGRHGVSATLTNNDPSSASATVAVASYSTNPVAGVVFFAGRFFDIQVTGASPTDSLLARFYYPSTITGVAENRLRLWFWNGTAWRRVVGSGGARPLKNTANNLDGTISGGRFTVMLDATSTPSIMDLGGTVFAIVEEEDRVAPVTTAGQSPAANANGWNNTDVAITLSATDEVSGVARSEFRVNGGGWQTYGSPILLRQNGVHIVDYRSVDEDGNVERARTTTVKIDKVDPIAIVIALPPLLLPANGKMVDITVLPVIVDLFSGVDKLTLVSVTSDDHGMTADDAAGWSIGTQDTSGKLRAEGTGGEQRTYSLTYRVTDRAGNQVLTTALVLVPRARLR